MEEYRKAKRMGDISSKKAVQAGQPPYLPALEDILEDESSRNPIFVGTMEIPLDQVKGTRTCSRKTQFGICRQVEQTPEFPNGRGYP